MQPDNAENKKTSLTLKQIAHGSPAYEEAVALRYRILRAPLGLVFTVEQLAAENHDTHLAAYSENRLVGSLTLTRIDATMVQMRQVAVDSDVQGTGIGRDLVRFAEIIAREQGFQTMMLHARESVLPFYLKLGYETYGEPFTEVTIPHRAMRKMLPK